jgi:hypothetical protein
MYDERPSVGNAVEFLLSYLRHGPQPAKDVWNASRSYGISEWGMKQAKSLLSVDVFKDGNHFYWRLPESYSNGSSAEDRSEDDIQKRIEEERERIRIREATRTLQQLQRTEAKRQEYLDLLRSVLVPFEVSPLIPLKSEKSKVPEVEWGLDLSDWQVGQSTPLATTGGLFEQTTEIAKEQLDRLWQGMRDIFRVEIESGEKRLKRLWLNFIGDLVEGDCLRPAQLRHIDRMVVQQVVEVADLAALLIRRCLTLPGLEEIIVDFVGGNHDRTTPRAGIAALGEADFVDTYAWLIGSWVQRMFENEPRVSVTVWDTFFGYRQFGGLYHAFEHGASFRSGSGSYGGIPWYPIANAAQQYLKMLTPEIFPRVDVVHMGHFHQPAVLPLGKRGWVILNGALPPSSAFIQASFKQVRVPLQWLVEYHPTRQWVNGFYPLYAGDTHVT